MPLTLYTMSANDGNAVKIAASLAGLEVKIAEVKTVHDKSVANKGPVLETESGRVFGVGACLRYIARSAGSGLYGATLFEASSVDQWVDFVSTTLAPNADAWLTPIQKNKPCDAEVFKTSKGNVNGALRAFNTYFNSNTFLVGHQVTIADILAFTVCVDLMTTVLPPAALKPLGNFVRWFVTIQHDPAFAAVYPNLELADKEAMAPKPEAKVAAAPKAAPKKPANDDEDDEETEAEKERKAAPKKVNPLSLLPPSTMELDSVKKLYFNQIPYNPNFFAEFWNIYDPAGYSVFTCMYKYNDENTVFWQTQNLVGGYIQRLDEGRKVSFGCMMLTGADEETKPWILQGTFIFRGPGVPEEVMEGNPQSEYYTWTKLDVSTDAGKAQFQELMMGTTVEGRNVLERRYFK